MTSGNYAIHCKVLGKLAKLYDLAAADVAELETFAGAFYDQIADGTSASWPTSQLFNPATGTLLSAIQSGAVALKAWAKDRADEYLRSTIFTATLTTAPASGTAKASLEAWMTDMGLDSETFTTAAASEPRKWGRAARMART